MGRSQKNTHKNIPENIAGSAATASGTSNDAVSDAIASESTETHQLDPEVNAAPIVQRRSARAASHQASIANQDAVGSRKRRTKADAEAMKEEAQRKKDEKLAEKQRKEDAIAEAKRIAAQKKKDAEFAKQKKSETFVQLEKSMLGSTASNESFPALVASRSSIVPFQNKSRPSMDKSRESEEEETFEMSPGSEENHIPLSVKKALAMEKYKDQEQLNESEIEETFGIDEDDTVESAMNLTVAKHTAPTKPLLGKNLAAMQEENEPKEGGASIMNGKRKSSEHNVPLTRLRLSKPVPASVPVQKVNLRLSVSENSAAGVQHNPVDNQVKTVGARSIKSLQSRKRELILQQNEDEDDAEEMGSMDEAGVNEGSQGNKSHFPKQMTLRPDRQNRSKMTELDHHGMALQFGRSESLTTNESSALQSTPSEERGRPSLLLSPEFPASLIKRNSNHSAPVIAKKQRITLTMPSDDTDIVLEDDIQELTVTAGDIEMRDSESSGLRIRVSDKINFKQPVRSGNFSQPKFSEIKNNVDTEK